jgi:diguanylate cyclase (GGDEF)-like protein
VDLDHFKEINDTRGHATGDRVLRNVAERLSDCLRASDMIARFGGDEFIVVVEGTTGRDDIAGIARKVRDVVAEPFIMDGESHRVTASIGISVYPEDGTDLETLFKHADSAMYQAKDLGRNRFGFFGS